MEQQNHIHLLLIIPTTITIADLVKQLKGVSAQFVNQSLEPDSLFRWQGSYGAYTVSPGDVGRVATYITQQKQHHLSGSDLADYEHG